MTIEVSGHAPVGKEFVCSAISALTDTLAILVMKNNKNESSVILKDGYGKITSNDPINRQYFDFVFCGFSQIAKAYSAWVEFREIL